MEEKKVCEKQSIVRRWPPKQNSSKARWALYEKPSVFKYALIPKLNTAR